MALFQVIMLNAVVIGICALIAYAIIPHGKNKPHKPIKHQH